MAAPVSVSVAPLHTPVDDGVADTPLGVVLTVIAPVDAVVLPQLFVAVSVYAPAAAVDTVNDAGDSRVEEKLFGPLQEKDVAPVAVPVRVSGAPLHRLVADGEADTLAGVVLIVIAVVVVVVLPQLLVAVSVYIPAAAVPTVNAAGFWSVEVKLLGPLHE